MKPSGLYVQLFGHLDCSPFHSFSPLRKLSAKSRVARLAIQFRMETTRDIPAAECAAGAEFLEAIRGNSVPARSRAAAAAPIHCHLGVPEPKPSRLNARTLF